MHQLERRETLHIHMPVYNSAPYIGEAIIGVLEDMEKSGIDDFRLMIADDASTDGTGEVLAGYAEHPKIDVSRNARNLGIGKNHKLLLQRSQREGVEPYAIAFRDSDDISIAGMGRVLLDELDEVGLVGGNVLIFRDDDTSMPVEQSRVDDNVAMRKNIIQGHIPTWNPTSMFRSEVADAERYPEVPFCDDLLFQADLLFQGVDIKHIDKPVVQYRKHQGSATTGLNPRNAYQYLNACRRIWEISGQRPSPTDLAFIAARTAIYLGVSTEGRAYSLLKSVYHKSGPIREWMVPNPQQAAESR